MADAASSAIPPQIPGGNELYDLLMSKIEPDLTTSRLPGLDSQYKGETPEDAKVRSERYEKAFAEYDRQLAEYLAGLQGKVRAYQSTARASVEHDEREKEEKELSNLEQEIGAA